MASLDALRELLTDHHLCKEREGRAFAGPLLPRFQHKQFDASGIISQNQLLRSTWHCGEWNKNGEAEAESLWAGDGR
jgi:hypothetical protein